MKVIMSKQTITEEIKKTIVHCDICGKIPTHHGPRTCEICKRDICKEHDMCDGYDMFTGQDGGDYPEHYCVDCHETAKPYVSQYKKFQREADEHLEKIYAEAVKACREKIQSQQVSDPR